MVRTVIRFALSAILCGAVTPVFATPKLPTPKTFKIGVLYAGSGPFASFSPKNYMALKLWAHQENEQGGVFIKAYDTRVPVKIIAYNDLSNPGLATTLYDRLITHDKVNILTSDTDSVMTAPAVAIAKEHKMLLLAPNGTSDAFYTNSNPYIILTANTVSSEWANNLIGFLNSDATRQEIKRVAIIYDTNDYATSLAKVLRTRLRAEHLQIVYDHGVPTSTSNYLVLLHKIATTQPDAVLEIGYPTNDAAFLSDIQPSGAHFKFIFTVFSGWEADSVLSSAGAHAMNYVYTFAPGSQIAYPVTAGMTLGEFRRAWGKMYPHSDLGIAYTAPIAGYTTAIVIQQALAHANGISQLDLRKAIFGLSGHLTTLSGLFKLNKDGAQVGEVPPIAQLIATGPHAVKFVIVYPSHVATGTPIYPAPAN